MMSYLDLSSNDGKMTGIAQQRWKDDITQEIRTKFFWKALG